MPSGFELDENMDESMSLKGLDSEPAQPAKQAPGKGKSSSFIMNVVIGVIELAGLRWTRRRLGTGVAFVIAAYRGYR